MAYNATENMKPTEVNLTSRENGDPGNTSTAEKRPRISTAIEEKIEYHENRISLVHNLLCESNLNIGQLRTTVNSLQSSIESTLQASLQKCLQEGLQSICNKVEEFLNTKCDDLNTRLNVNSTYTQPDQPTNQQVNDPNTEGHTNIISNQQNQQSRSSERAIEQPNIEETVVGRIVDEHEETVVGRIVDEETVGEAEEAENYNLVGNSTYTTSAKKNKAKSHKDVAEQQMPTAFNKLTNVLPKRKPETPSAYKEEDECDLYAKLLAKRIRELPKDERQITMYEIDGFLIKRIQLRSFARETPSPQYSFPYSTALSTSSAGPTCSTCFHFKPRIIDYLHSITLTTY